MSRVEAAFQLEKKNIKKDNLGKKKIFVQQRRACMVKEFLPIQSSVPFHTNFRQCIHTVSQWEPLKNHQKTCLDKRIVGDPSFHSLSNKGRNAGAPLCFQYLLKLAPSANNKVRQTMFDKQRCRLIHCCCYHDSRVLFKFFFFYCCCSRC